MGNSPSKKGFNSSLGENLFGKKQQQGVNQEGFYDDDDNSGSNGRSRQADPGNGKSKKQKGNKKGAQSAPIEVEDTEQNDAKYAKSIAENTRRNKSSEEYKNSGKKNKYQKSSSTSSFDSEDDRDPQEELYRKRRKMDMSDETIAQILERDDEEDDFVPTKDDFAPSEDSEDDWNPSPGKKNQKNGRKAPKTPSKFVAEPDEAPVVTTKNGKKGSKATPPKMKSDKINKY